MAATPQLSDAQLARAVHQDPDGFGELYRRHERSVLSYFLRWTGSAALAADLTAETFAVALESIANFDAERGPFVGWLFGIARHVLARSLERGRVEDAARNRLGMPPLTVDDDAYERIDALASLDGSVLKLMLELEGPLRDAVTGRIIEERDYRDLAEALACSPALARQRVHRGLAKLRTLMEARR